MLHLNGCFLLYSCTVAAFFGLDVKVIMITDPAVTDSALLPVFLFKII